MSPNVNYLSYFIIPSCFIQTAFRAGKYYLAESKLEHLFYQLISFRLVLDNGLKVSTQLFLLFFSITVGALLNIQSLISCEILVLMNDMSFNSKKRMI